MTKNRTVPFDIPFGPLATIFAAIITGVIAALLTAYLQQQNWKKQFTIQAHQSILNKRLDLMEKFAKLHLSVLTTLSVHEQIPLLKPEQIPRELRKMIYDYRILLGEINSLSSMIKTFFGPQTAKALLEYKESIPDFLELTETVRQFEEELYVLKQPPKPEAKQKMERGMETYKRNVKNALTKADRVLQTMAQELFIGLQIPAIPIGRTL